MNTYIYDIEVFSDDWLVIFKAPDSDTYHVIHNDNYKLRAFLEQPDLMLGGFNNKHYDDWVILTMYLGGSNVEVKKHNDWIIGGGNGWEFPFVQFKKRPFNSFDLRHDIADKGLSLKAIEGNLCLPIVESSVPFDIDRPLTKKELDEVIFYCKHDVDSTVRLYEERKDYIESKKIVGNIFNIPESKTIGLTNAGLASIVLGAEKTKRDDEREYRFPDNLKRELIPQCILDFFETIHDKTIPDDKLFKTSLAVDFNGCPCVYAWGGVHGAKPCYIAEATEDNLIVNFDVASLYPNSMINFGYVSRSAKDPDAYENVVKTRLKAKREGDKAKAGALKLVVNTTYGAMLNEHNELYDAWAGRSVCITNQIAMTELVVSLAKRCKSFDIINFNTDGVMFHITKKEIDDALEVIHEWEHRTGFELERDDIKKIIQKDVNNYLCVKTDGKLKAKGGYAKLYAGGDFKTNSLVIVHKALVDYLFKGVPPEDTINNATNIFDFQMIAKTGSTYFRSVQYIDGKPVELQKVNRIYATTDERYGTIKKQKLIKQKTVKGKIIKYDPPLLQEDTLADCPEHCRVDNENVLTLNDIDKSYYINMAKKRINDYLINKKTNIKMEVIRIMATTKTSTEKATKTVDAHGLNIYQKLALAREKFLAAPVKKTGVNRFAEYKYFELADIVPVATSIFKDLGLLYVVSFTEEIAAGALINTDEPNEVITFTSPMKDLVVKGMNAVQALGGTETYQRRYLYMVCLDIVEADPFDATQGKSEDKSPAPATPKKSNKPATPEKREEIKKELIDADGSATEVQIKSIKNGLKKLRAKDGEKYEKYVTDNVKKIKAGLTKSDAEAILLDISEKVAE